MVESGMPILSPVDLLPGGKIDVRRVPLLGIHNGETLSEFPGLDKPTSARVLGHLLYAVAGASFKRSSRTLETFENTEPLSPSARSSGNNMAKFREFSTGEVRGIPPRELRRTPILRLSGNSYSRANRLTMSRLIAA